MLALTESAAAAIHDLTSGAELPAGAGLRIAPKTGNSGGPAFAASLVQRADPDDQVIDTGEARVYLESGIAGQLGDKVLDAEVDENGVIAFRVSPQSNPAT
ncbi:adhesin [Actinospica sp.]|jgi:Fe-S cluster assembly iron-binding protein IscA|uniref:adhesin n=1 Tax=Actinospica sp. TaxID=1872142 RepID=UPI002B9E4BA8|nr:adhesin [Actinospica sp.]HWG23771.1 adhesin [Actinospica sp.]